MDEVIKKIVLLMVYLAILGCIIAGVHYVVIDLPMQQAALQPPPNMSWPRP
ncbi:hypothetical protein [Methanoregula sp.]|uniref:hypothetical protein n=1 Tax=Methanoregula sp. TaxID=2052170 RepID=UPI003567ECAD